MKRHGCTLTYEGKGNFSRRILLECSMHSVNGILSKQIGMISAPDPLMEVQTEIVPHRRRKRGGGQGGQPPPPPQ